MSDQQPFQAEVQQLLDIVINSLYTDKDIFVRELVSNASDALEKMRLTKLTENEVHQPDAELEITLQLDEEAKTIIISDTGIGMDREELIENLGTIAHSGTKAFLKAAKDKGKDDPSVIGQFGVGFYSAFMVADKVEVFTRSWHPEAEGLVWTSDGKSGYTIDGTDEADRGTKIVIHLTEENEDFAKEFRIKQLLEQYSNFVGFPITLGEERVNTVEAVWLKSKSDVSDEEYSEFYKFQANAHDEPRYRLHFSADAPIAINALLFVPTENPEIWGMGQIEPGVALYCKKVLIDPKPEGLLPEWMRFVKGVIDSEDIPLNISRESMQDSALVRKIGEVIAKRFLKHLAKEAKDNPEGYAEFYGKFSRFLKEGMATDFANREAIAKLLRYESSMTEPGELCSLDDYVDRAKEGQEHLYYQVAPNRGAIESGPYLEAFKARGIEVLFMLEAIDEYVANNLGEIGTDDKKLSPQAIDHASVDLGKFDADDASDPEGLVDALAEDDASSLCEWLKESLGARAKEVKVGTRLIGSPAAALQPEGAIPAQMRHMMRAMNPDAAEEADAVDLEINPRHPLVHKLNAARESNPELATLVAAQVFDNALMAAGLLDDPKDMVSRVYDLMGKALD